MASDSPGTYLKSHDMADSHECLEISGLLSDTNGARGNFQLGVVGSYYRDSSFVIKDSGYYVNTSDGASTCSSSTTETNENESGTLLVLEPKSLRSFTTNDEYLYAMKEDLADWFACLYQREDITAENFLQMLETGVLLCKHANKVQEFARQRREMGETLEMRSYFIRSVPEGNVSFRENVKPETFQARDNVSNFISWGRQLGIPEVLSFETDDLVLRKNEKSVILCLLEIARVGAKLGMLAPTLIQMEQEIDAELAGEEPKPQIQIITCDMRSLDERVRDLIGRCTCPVQFPMIKVGEGKYKIGDSRSLIFVRILRNHVMVRVGGGWDTLENYLNKHDPCQCNYRGHRPSNSGVAHKVVVNQQRQPATTSNASSRPTPGTPTSPRRGSSVAAAANRNRSSSPHSNSSSKAPALVISRHMPVPSKSGSGQGTTKGAGGPVTTSQKPATAAEGMPRTSSSSSSHSTRPKSPNSSKRRSPSPRDVSETAPQPSQVPRVPSNLAQTRNKDSSQDNKMTAARRDASLYSPETGNSPGEQNNRRQSDFRRKPSISDNDDENVDNDGYLTEHEEYDNSRRCDKKRYGSFDGNMTLHSGLEQGRDLDPDNAGKTNVNIERISTMTLAEFKSLLSSSSLSVPEDQKPGHVDARDSRISDSSYGADSAMDSYKPKTPMSVSRIKTLKESGNIGKNSTKEEFKMACPKPASQIKREAVAKVPGAISNLVETQNDADSSHAIPNRPKTPTRPKTLIGSNSNMSQNFQQENGGEENNIATNSLTEALATTARERPATPSRIPKPSFIPRPKTPSSFVTDLPGDTTNHQFSPTQQIPTPNFTRLNISAATRPVALSRSNSNSSSVKSVDETPVSPANSFSEDRVFKIHTRTRRPSNSSDGLNSNSSSAGRSYKDIYTAKKAGASGSDGRILHTRAVTPGPREKWTLGGGSSGGNSGGPSDNAVSTPNIRRRSINTTCQTDKHKSSIPLSSLCRNGSASSIETDPQMTITNEITFSDDEEINELIKNAALKTKVHNMRSSSVDARKLIQKSTKRNEEEVLMIQRDVNMKGHSDGKFSIVRRPDGSSTGRASPSMVSSKLYKAGRNKELVDTSPSSPGDEHINRTEAWVDSTIPDNKKKPGHHPKRTKGSGNDIPASELAPRPLEEIQAILTEPKNGLVCVDTTALEAPPEDLEMFKKMERLFEKYKEMELKSSSNENKGQGGIRQVTNDKSATDSHSAKGETHRSLYRVSKPSALKKTSSVSSGHSVKGSSNEDKPKRSAITPVPFQNQQHRYLSNNFSALVSPSQESKEYFSHNSSTYNTTSGTYDEPIGLDILKDIDPEIANNPTALISKIKEILQVRPRKDENTKGSTRIPAPATLNRYNRSRSVTNLCSDNLNTNSTLDSKSSQQSNNVSLHQSTYSGSSYNEYSKNNSQSFTTTISDSAYKEPKESYNQTFTTTYSGASYKEPNENYSQSFTTPKVQISEQIPSSEYNKTDDPEDEVPDLPQALSSQYESSDGQNRSETPVPKLSTPLTTGRSTLFSSRRSVSQDKENMSKPQTNVSGRQVLSSTEDEAGLVSD